MSTINSSITNTNPTTTTTTTTAIPIPTNNNNTNNNTTTDSTTNINNNRNNNTTLSSTNNINNNNVNTTRVSPLKPVYRLLCKHCRTIVCARGMRAILLADTKIELYSTDIPATSIQLMDKDYLTRTCHCRIRDVACRDCGNIIGYHVVAPCHQCLQAGNNGHFWMFHSDACQPQERKDISGKKKIKLKK
ncbi:FAM72 protein-domain-containing protein [Circinella umbellata]|nr:FAM72 protein-domain-containing protein [Circinella umbellata]